MRKLETFRNQFLVICQMWKMHIAAKLNDLILSKAYSVKVILFDHLRNLFLRDIYKKATKLKRLQKSEMKLFMSSKTCLYFIFNMKLCWQRRFLPFLIFLFLISLFTEGLKEHFSKFGDIAEVMVMKDPTTRRSRYEMKLDIFVYKYESC